MKQLKSIICFEAGSGEQPPWRCSLDEIGNDIDLLRSLDQERLIELVVSENAVTIAGRDRVGLAILPSGRRLIIRTKIPSVAILDWLIFLGEIPGLETWLQESGVTSGEDFHICISKLFLLELESLTRLHLRKDYVVESMEGLVVRGRIQMKDFACSVHRLPRLPLVHRCRTLDTPFNAVLALALDRLRHFFFDFPPQVRTRFSALRDQWTSIRREIKDPVTAVTEAQWACPSGYRNALQLARLILLGLSLDPNSRMGGQAFTISLALIWERSLRQMFTNFSSQTGWFSVADEMRTRMWDDSYGKKDPNRWLSADIIVEKPNRRWVLDAKYKRAFGTESRADRFQMCAYAVAFDADRVTLIYPTAKADTFGLKRLLRTSVGAKEVIVDSLELPMSQGPQACLNALIRVCENVDGAAPVDQLDVNRSSSTCYAKLSTA